MQLDRQSILYGIIEGALRAAADPSVTTVLRDWDHYAPGDTAQPLAPFLVVGLTDDSPYGIGIPLYRCAASVMIVAASTPSVRETFSRIRTSVRSVMSSIPHISVAGLTVSGCMEVGCTQPDRISDSGDLIYAQTLTFRVWFQAAPPPPAVLDPVIYLCDRNPDTGVTYTTTQAEDPRRIDRWTPSASGVMLSQGFGDWADRASLDYTSPVQPLATHLPPPAPADHPVTT